MTVTENTTRKHAVLSLSGGMDSTSLLIKLIKEGYRVTCLSFLYGQKHWIECRRAEANIAYLNGLGYNIPHHVINIESAMVGINSSLLSGSDQEIPEGHYAQDNMKQTVVPNRNAIFSSIVYAHALSLVTGKDQEAVIALGIHSGDHSIYPDCRTEFRDALSHAFKIGNWESEKVSYYAPYLQMDKYAILVEARENCRILNLDFRTIFKNTNTSYNPTPDGLSSGTSGADIERILAFHKLGVPDPIQYTKPWEEVVKNALEVEKNFLGGESSSPEPYKPFDQRV